MPSNRKLFFTTSITTNDSVCPDNLCIDPDCPFADCPSYPDPPSSSFFPPPDPPTTFSDQSFQLSPFLIIVIALISALLVLIIYYFAVVKLCFDCLLLRRRTPDVRQNATEENDHVEIITDDDEPQEGPQVDHPIWLINTVGLQQSIINTITLVKYRRGEGLIEGMDCSVCLSEFQENETLRLLPKCSHAFHVGCIDTWLRSHTNCPMCRALITVSGNDGPSNPSSSRNAMGRIGDPEMSEIELTNNDMVNEESFSLERVNLVVDDSDGNKLDTSFEDGAKPIRRCMSMSCINFSGCMGQGDRNEYLDSLQGNRFCLRRSSSSGARLYM